MTDHLGQLGVWLHARRLRRFHHRCSRLGIPMDVRERILRGQRKPAAPHWYAGRKR